ncbi:transcription antitermination factor NusB [Buchnera aphidicola]|uniref:transcription antitermination factor NusB n=1 Tax=Buchnera aphidicola TaxID=9 RepID=UPI003463C061
MEINTRTKTRQLIIQILYAWELSQNNIFDIQKQYLGSINNKNIDIHYLHDIITGIRNHCHIIDKKITLYLHRASKELGQIEKAILRLSFYELYERLDIPYKVSINESIELAKLFGSQNSHKFINGILDQVCKKIKNNH